MEVLGVLAGFSELAPSGTDLGDHFRRYDEAVRPPALAGQVDT